MKLFLVPAFVFVVLLFRPVKYRQSIQRDAWLYFLGAVVCVLFAFAG